MFKLTSIYRASKGECVGELRPGRPDWFNKFKCWDSFYYSFNTCSNIIVVWDGDKNELFDYISKYDNISLVTIDEKSNKKSSLKCVDMISDLDCSHFYFSEDDWFYTPRSGQVLIEGLTFPLFQSHFVTLYDRPHAYFYPCDDISFGYDYIFWTGSTHFRSTESAMFTFGMNRQFFLSIIDDVKRFINVPGDAAQDREMFRFLIKKNIRVFNPIPGKATHCIKFDLSPGICYN